MNAKRQLSQTGQTKLEEHERTISRPHLAPTSPIANRQSIGRRDEDHARVGRFDPGADERNHAIELTVSQSKSRIINCLDLGCAR
jgi:hypothetical protein